MNIAELAGEVSIAALRCRCGSPDVVAIDPGEPPVIDVQTDKMLRRGRPITGRCLACLLTAEPAARRPLECWRCAGTDADGLVFTRSRKPRGRPLLCTDCAEEPPRSPVLRGPVFVAQTYRRAERRRMESAQIDIEDVARGIA